MVLFVPVCNSLLHPFNVIGPLPRSEDKDAILVVVDQFSKMIRLMATTTSISSSEVTRIYQDDIWKIHSIPRKIISDRGPQFASTFMGELYKVLEIKRAVTNFIRSCLHQIFDDSHGLKASLKPLRRPFDRCQSRLEAINIGQDIKQINW